MAKETSQNRARDKRPTPVGQPSAERNLEATLDGEITIFLSYSRADDDVYDMVHPFKKMLSHFVYAKSGRKIRAFLDQESIDWGEVWRDRLETEILGASVFIPLLSASYLDSENCRLEFNRFQANASALGVRELLLPVLVINAPAIFNENSTDDIVREAAARQWEIIEEAVLSDPGSAAWKRTMARLADRFVKSYEAAEAKLGDIEPKKGAPAEGLEAKESLPAAESAEEEYDATDDDDTPGLAELVSSLQTNVGEMTASAQAMGPAIESLGKAASSAGEVPANPTPHQLQAWSFRVAQAFEGPAVEISGLGERMFEATKATDIDIERLRRIATEFLAISPDLARDYNAMLGQLSGLEGVSDQLNDLLTQIKPAEAFSVPLRKSLRPARRGLTRVTDSIRLIQAWRPIPLSGGLGAE